MYDPLHSNSVVLQVLLQEGKSLMSFRIDKERTPFLAQQPEVVQDVARQFHQNYTSKNSVKVRATWGAFLEQIQNGLVAVTVGKGDKAHALDNKETFAGICRELGIPRSTAYSYIHTYIVVSNYPQAIQEAAEEAGLNLALPHVMAEFQKMTLPTNPSPLELRGIIAQLEEAKPAETETEEEPLLLEEFQKKLSKLVARARKSGIAFRATLEIMIEASYEARKAYKSAITVEEAVAEMQRAWTSLEAKNEATP